MERYFHNHPVEHRVRTGSHFPIGDQFDDFVDDIESRLDTAFPAWEVHSHRAAGNCVNRPVYRLRHVDR